MALIVEKTGWQILSVGPPRPGHRHQGLPDGGPFDHASARLALALVGGVEAHSVLEMLGTNLEFRATSPMILATMGTSATLLINDSVIIPVGCSFRLNDGDRLTICEKKPGTRLYLACAGNQPEKASIFPKQVQRGERLFDFAQQRNSNATNWKVLLQLPWVNIDVNRHDHPIRVLPGSHQGLFPNHESFYQVPWKITAQANRMGLRLQSEKPLTYRGHELRSEPVSIGTIQVTHAGNPIILGVEGQTIGGYLRLAHVIRADWDRLAQYQPGEQIRFVQIDLAEACRLWFERAQLLTRWLVALNAPEFRSTAEEAEES